MPYLALQNLAEDNMASIQPGGLDCSDEELAAVGVLTGVGHAQPHGSIVGQLKVLVIESWAEHTVACMDGTVTLQDVCMHDSTQT